MLTQLLRYALDPTGTNPNNYVNAEPHALVDGLFVRAVAPTYGAFFTESIQIYDASTNALLTRGTQYVCTELLDNPTEIYAKEICYLILIKDRAVSSSIRISYQALGGPYTRSADAIVNIYNSFQNDKRPVSWPEIISKPERFPPGPHLHDVGDVYGFEYLVFACERIRNALLLTDVPGYEKVLTYISSQLKSFKTTVQAQIDQLAGAVTATSLVSKNNNGLMSSTDKVNLDYLTALQAVIPDRSVILYRGLPSQLPPQWKVCNGTNGTPNMTDVAPSGSAFNLVYIEYFATINSPVSNLFFVGGSNTYGNAFPTGQLVTLTDTLVNTSSQPVVITFGLIRNGITTNLYPGSTKIVTVPPKTSVAVTSSFTVDIATGNSTAQFCIASPAEHVGKIGNLTGYSVTALKSSASVSGP